ncbi:MAG: tRNA pseudouridine(55) synthase TruB [Oscillospiraceae bacterium]|nr:tRNA pseudouridine(55) synthase TruB [Candidatus Limimonas coprohippi]MCQ2487934.1 tRNA pseudouridine(55) synthase TruB [Clostridia bacterium]
MTGFINLYKPEGITSFLCVAKVRRIMGEKKAGHCGTLDPMAEGVLPIMLGGATRFLEFLPDSKKRYTAKMRLGLTTDTLDITGTVLSESEVTSTYEDVLLASEKYRGDIMQVPPMYSALNKDGVKLYKLARQGVEVEREPRPATISRLDIKEADKENEYILDIECSSGTYVRTLIDDIGRDLGCGAVMTELLRTMGAGFDISKTVTLEELENAPDPSVFLISVEEALNAYPTLVVSDGQSHRFCNGGDLNLDRIKGSKVNGLYRVYSPDKKFIGLGEADDEKGTLAFRRVYQER